MKSTNRAQTDRRSEESTPEAEPGAGTEPAACQPVAVPGLHAAAQPGIRRTAAMDTPGEPGGARVVAVLRSRAAAAPTTPDGPEQVRRVLRSTGQPLDEPTRTFMEPRLGADLGDVRIHAGPAAAESAHAVAARAYTVGQDIVFGADEYQPGTTAGRHLLAHELVHTVQNRSSTIARTPSGDLQISEPTDPLEVAAEARATELMSGAPQAIEQPTAEPAVDGRGGGRLLRAAHTNQFRAFALAQAPGIGGPQTEAQQLATLLDYNDYERREVIEKLTELDGTGQRIDPVVNLGLNAHLVAAIRWMQANSPINPANSPAVAARLRTVLNSVTGTDYSSVVWGAATPWGAGTEVQATIRPGGQAQGSDAGGEPRWMLVLQQRIGKDGRSMYCRGHLLNRHLGGPGLDYNMVPLTQTAVWGANDANALHSDSIEQTVKEMAEKVGNGQADEVTNLQYRVRAVYGRAARPQTGQIRALQQQFSTLVQQFQRLAAENADGRMVGIDQAPDNAVDQLYQNVSQQPTVPNGPVHYPIGQFERGSVIGALRQGLSRNLMNDAIQNLPLPVRTWLDTQLNPLQVLVSVLQAVSTTGNYQDDTVSNLEAFMRENAAVWELEDQVLPVRLELHATWTQFGNTEVINEPVPIRPPTALNAWFRMRGMDD